MVLFAAALLLFAQNPDYSAEGMKALEEQRWEAAAQAFEKAAAADPKDYAARFHHALALGMLKRDAEAAADYRAVLELKPGLYEAQLNLGMILLRQKQAAAAVAPLEAAAEQKPGEFRPVFYAGEALFTAGQFEKAEACYAKAVEIDPKSAAAHLGLGRTRARLGRLDDAAPSLRTAARLDASYRDGLLELASLYEKAKRPEAALAIYREFPEIPAARERAGELLLETGKAADAIPQLEEAVAKSPTTANRFALAAAYMRSNQPAKAAPLLDQATAAEPGNYDLHITYGRALLSLHQFPGAAREFLRAAQIKPGAAEAWSELSTALILTENYPQALAALDRVRALGGEKPGHLYFRAITLDRTKQLKPALEAYRQFLAASQNQNPNEEFKARQRIRIIEKELAKK